MEYGRTWLHFLRKTQTRISLFARIVPTKETIGMEIHLREEFDASTEPSFLFASVFFQSYCFSSISYPESSGFLVSGRAPGKTQVKDSGSSGIQWPPFLLGCLYGNPSRKMGGISSFSSYCYYWVASIAILPVGKCV